MRESPEQRMCHGIKPLILMGFWQGQGFREAKAAMEDGRKLPHFDAVELVPEKEGDQ